MLTHTSEELRCYGKRSHVHSTTFTSAAVREWALSQSLERLNWAKCHIFMQQWKTCFHHTFISRGSHCCCCAGVSQPWNEDFTDYHFFEETVSVALRSQFNDKVSKRALSGFDSMLQTALSQEVTITSAGKEDRVQTIFCRVTPEEFRQSSVIHVLRRAAQALSSVSQYEYLDWNLHLIFGINAASIFCVELF